MSEKKLYRVEVERTEWAVVYVEARGRSEAEDAAMECSRQINTVDWEDGGRDIMAVHTIDAEAEASLRSGEWGAEANTVVDNDPEYRTPLEWLDANAEPKR